MRRTAALALTVAALAGCGSASTTAARTSPVTSPTDTFVPVDNTLNSDPTSLPTPAPTPVPTPQAQPLGQSVTTTTSLSFTVLEWRASVASNNQFNTPPPGGHFAAAKVKECAGTAAPVLANPSSWRLILSDESQVNGDQADLLNVPGAVLNLTNLQPSQCDVGWIGFTIPGGVSATKLAPSNSDFFWTVT